MVDMVCRDVFVRYTAEDGDTSVMCHRVWDAERFLQAQRDAAAQVGGKSHAEQITEERYQQERTR